MAWKGNFFERNATRALARVDVMTPDTSISRSREACRLTSPSLAFVGSQDWPRFPLPTSISRCVVSCNYKPGFPTLNAPQKGNTVKNKNEAISDHAEFSASSRLI